MPWLLLTIHLCILFGSSQKPTDQEACGAEACAVARGRWGAQSPQALPQRSSVALLCGISRVQTLIPICSQVVCETAQLSPRARPPGLVWAPVQEGALRTQGQEPPGRGLGWATAVSGSIKS